MNKVGPHIAYFKIQIDLTVWELWQKALCQRSPQLELPLWPMEKYQSKIMKKKPTFGKMF